LIILTHHTYTNYMLSVPYEGKWVMAVKLVKDSERTKSKMFIFCIVLIFALIFMTFDRHPLDR